VSALTLIHNYFNLHLGQDISNMLVVTETMKTPRTSALVHNLPSAKKKVPFPEGLKVRFTTFGTGKKLALFLEFGTNVCVVVFYIFGGKLMEVGGWGATQMYG
jgi:hypothetical protein